MNRPNLRHYEDGELLVREGDAGREMFIVTAGRVRIAKETGEGEVTLGYVERGEFFGEMALLESLPRMANAYAVGETSVQLLGAGDLLVRIRRDPTLAVEMLSRLSSRLRVANTRLLDLLQVGDDGLEAARAWETSSQRIEG